MCTFVLDNDEIKTYCKNEDGFLLFWTADGCCTRVRSEHWEGLYCLY